MRAIPTWAWIAGGVAAYLLLRPKTAAGADAVTVKVAPKPAPAPKVQPSPYVKPPVALRVTPPISEIYYYAVKEWIPVVPILGKGCRHQQLWQFNTAADAQRLKSAKLTMAGDKYETWTPPGGILVYDHKCCVEPCAVMFREYR